MNNSIKKVLIVGGGFSGMSAAIQLRKLKIEVDLVEINKDWAPDGAGITLGGATYRALETIGVLPEVLKQGYGGDDMTIRNAEGELILEVKGKRMLGEGLPAHGAIMRSVLADILAKATVDSGTNVRLGCTFTDIKQDAEGVDVTFTDDSTHRYDIVIGTDGLFSKVRAALFPEAAQPKFTRQAVWRAVLPRPAEITQFDMWHGPHLKFGLHPVSKEEMYVYLTENKPVNEYVDPKNWVELLKGLMNEFSAQTVKDFSQLINEDCQINYRPLEGILLPLPWFKNRVVLMGDAVHATTPHLAMGAGIGIEDAVVIAEEIEQANSIDDALNAFQNRRWERCRMVVENSGRLGQIEVDDGDKEEHMKLMMGSIKKLQEAI